MREHTEAGLDALALATDQISERRVTKNSNKIPKDALRDSRRVIEAAMHEADRYTANSGRRHTGELTLEQTAHQRRIDLLLAGIFTCTSEEAT